MDPLFLHVSHDACPVLIIDIDGKVNILQIGNIILGCLLLPSSNVLYSCTSHKVLHQHSSHQTNIEKNELMNQLPCPFPCFH